MIEGNLVRFFRSLKVLDEKFADEKKNFEFAKAHLSHVEHRVIIEIDHFTD